MARLTMVAPSELAIGFRLAGTDVVTVDDPADTEAVMARLARDPEVGVIGIYAPLFDGLEPAIQHAYEDLVAPVVIAVPLGAAGSEEMDHRARLASLLQRAIGYRFSFGEGVET